MAAAGAAAALVPEGESRELPWRDLTAQVGPLFFKHPESHYLPRHRYLAGFIRHHAPGRSPRIPSLDFTRERAVVFTAGPRSSSGYDLRVLRVVERRSRVYVHVRERFPRVGERVVPRVTYPYRLIAVPRSSKPVTVRWEGRP